MPFFFGCLWRESWLLATLLSALASASREATILSPERHIQKFQVFYEIISHSGFTSSAYLFMPITED